MTTFTAPVLVGSKRHEPNRDIGPVVTTQFGTLTFDQTGASDLFVLPGGSRILDVIVDVTTVFNAATNNTLDIGTAADPDAFLDGALDNLETVGRINGAAAATVVNYDVGASPVTVQTTYTTVGAAPTTGEARIAITYAIDRVLPA